MVDSLQYPSLYLGVTTRPPAETDFSVETTKQPDARVIDTVHGELHINGEDAGAHNDWRKTHGQKLELDEGDDISVLLNTDRSLSIITRGKTVNNVFTNLPNQPMWLIIACWLNKIQAVPGM